MADSLKQPGQAGTRHKGTTLPKGMDAALADWLEREIVAYVDDPSGYPFDFGIKLFREIAESLESARVQ